MAIPYYRWFPGDYARDTRHLSLMQHGVYRLLIDLYMDQGASLRNDLPYLYRWLHAESVEEKNAIEFVLGEFFVLLDNRWHHKRCDAELAWRTGKSKEATAAINRRWGKDGDTDVIRTYNARSFGRNTNQNQNQNQISDPKPDLKPNQAKSKTTRAKARSVAAYAAPACVDPRVWAEYVEHRKAKRAPLTAGAVALIERDLTAMDDPDEALRQSIKNGWTGVFRPRNDKRDGISEWVRQSTERDITNDC